MLSRSQGEDYNAVSKAFRVQNVRRLFSGTD
jgi:hypothetical protein